jgi:hypothetical protein
VEFIAVEKITVRKLSFIGHSMGAIVARASLQSPTLAKYFSVLQTFVSFSAPHLGTYNGKSRMMGPALWVLGTIKSAICIQQLQLIDPFLVTLSRDDKIGHFRNVLLFSCERDSFVNAESASITAAAVGNNSATSDKPKDKKLAQMNEIASRLNDHLRTAHTTIRIAVHFGSKPAHYSKQSSIDRLTGKSFHVAFLCNADFLITFVNLYRDMFI